MSWSESVESIRYVIQTMSKRVTSKKNGGSRYWNASSMDELLNKQGWSKLMEYIYDVLDNHRCMDAVDWIKVRANQGYVPIMYIYIRNGVKSIGSRVLCTTEFEDWVRTWVMFCFRVVEDTVTCSSVMGIDKSAVTTTILHKTRAWLESYESLEEWPAPFEIMGTIDFDICKSHVPYNEFDTVCDNNGGIDNFTESSDKQCTYKCHSNTNTVSDFRKDDKNDSVDTCSTVTTSVSRTTQLSNMSLLDKKSSVTSSSCVPVFSAASDTSSIKTKMFDYANPAWIPGFSVSSVGNSVYFKTSDVQTHNACMHNTVHFRETQRHVRTNMHQQLVTELMYSNKWETWMIVINKILSEMAAP